MKNIRFIVLSVSLVILCAQASIAQNTTFKLSDYKNPNYLYQSLDLNFGFSNTLNYNKYNSISAYSGNTYSLSSNAGATYSRHANSPKYQAERYISFGAGIGSSGNHFKQDFIGINQERNANSFRHNENLSIYALNRFYNEKQNYIEVNGSLSTSYNSNSGKNKLFNADTLTTSTKSNANNSGNNVSGAFLIGKGRIEQVQDARLALYLLDDLHRLNRDKRSASDEEVIALAHLITSLKYKRFFDDRLRKIAEITAIDSFMQKNKIAGTPDAAYFTSLNDNWNFANNPTRNSGRRIFTGIEGDFTYNYSKSKEDDKVTNESTFESTDKLQYGSIFLVAGLNFEKPLNLKWQQSANLKAGIGSIYQLQSHKVITPATETNTDTFTGKFPAVKLSADYGYGYYPNSRTWLTVNWQLSAGYEKQMTGTSRKDKENSQNNFFANTGPHVNAYYYLSEKLRLSFAFNGLFQLTKDKDTYDGAPLDPDNKRTYTSWVQSLSAALTYSLF